MFCVLTSPNFRFFLNLRSLVVVLVLWLTAAVSVSALDCGPGTATLPQNRDPTVDLKVTGTCYVNGTIDKDRTSLLFVFHNVNIVGGGSLIFQEGKPIDFWAESILVEFKGTLTALSSTSLPGYKTRLTIHLWGASTDDGIECQSTVVNGAPCGIPPELWTANTGMAMNMVMTNPPPPAVKNAACKSITGFSQYLPGDDCFYQYEVQDAQDIKNNKKAYFGHKVLAVSFGGTLQMRGAKGSTFQDPLNCKPSVPGNECNPATTGKSWVRLTQVSQDKLTLTLNGPVDWQDGDHIVVTTTDYLPEHSEEVILNGPAKGNTVTLKAPGLNYMHNTNVYALPAVDPTNGPTSDIGPTDDPNHPDVKHAVDTRAAVGLLTRNIQVVSEGNKATPDSGVDNFPPTAGTFYGGHTIVRQGFLSYFVQGVEFYRLGQGGAKGRYAIHFHMVRKTAQPTMTSAPPVNYVKDCSIHESMTRWLTLHDTQGMYVARNVGYLSIGHGYYLEDGTEVDNKVYANLGVMARAAITSATLNPRGVPGILADTITGPPPPATNPFPINDEMPYRSDFQHPTVFWIMNGWNDLQYNFAAGAATCGACYWWLPSAVSGPSQYQHFDGYASQQLFIQNHSLNNMQSAGLTPLKNFYGNSCVAAMTAFQTVGTTSDCLGVLSQGGDGSEMVAVPSVAPAPQEYANINAFDVYYPAVSQLHNPTTCNNFNVAGTDCSKDSVGNPAPQCSNENPVNCAATVLDRLTTSFNWAQTNFSAVWLRPKWFLVRNSAITDVQTGGLNFVTGGGYTRADIPVGYWSLVRKSAFVGHSQPFTANNVPANPYASDAGPFNPYGIKTCDNGSAPDHCLSFSQGITFLLPPFPGQRLLNIYDGPAFQELNYFLDVNTTTITDCTASNGQCEDSEWPLSRNLGVLQTSTKGCYLPNAAIAWKQPNGFYYPPAFNSRKLWFANVDIRHFVVEPFFTTNPADPNDPFFQNQPKIMGRYCTYNTNTFGGFNHIDRQTVLNDDDGSLTGLLANDTQLNAKSRETISINEDDYFNSPLITPECLSDVGVTPLNPNKAVYTARTSPYEWLTTAMIADCALPTGSKDPSEFQCFDSENRIQWARDCTDPSCRGVPLFREYLTVDEENMKPKPQPQIRMMGQATAQRSTLTLNQGAYYIDTTQTCTTQGAAGGQCPVCVTNPNGVGCSPAVGSAHPTVFLPGMTYHVFFIYAKPTTHQTYDIYVGKDEDLKVTPELGYLPGNFKFTPFPAGTWVTAGKYDPTSGTIRITVDLKNYQTAFDNSKYAQGFNFCQPSNFCSVKTVNNQKTCGCNPSNSQCTDDAVCAWGEKQLDCPLNVDGTNPSQMQCFGFSFTMPGDFTIPNPNNTPDPSVFTAYTTNTYFTKNTVVTFTNKLATGADVQAGVCNYTTLPTQP